MLKKIKDMVSLREDVDILNTNFMVNKKLVEELADEYKEELEKLKEIKQYQTEFLAEFKQNMFTIRQLRDEMQKEMEAIRSVKFEMQKEMARRFENQLNNLMDEFSKELSIEKQDYEKAKQQIEAAAQNLFLLHGEVGKLLDYSKQIKKGDFELQRYQQTLVKEDKNKLELMKRIDDLERMLAKMKQRPR